MTSYASVPEIITYYERKAQAILQRYGPGPRVHYHTGLVDKPLPPGSPAQVLRKELVAAQERMLSHAADVWHAQSTLDGNVLDIGCGLGGGALFWAQEFGAQVTAVVNVPTYVNWVARFAAEAGIASRVQPLLCDALEVPGESCFDAAVAVECTCYLPREVWLRRMASLLRPRGHVFIADCFLGRSEYKEPFNHYWRTQIGTVAEYVAAAQKVGLQEEVIDDLSSRTEHFWTMTLELIHAEAREKKPPCDDVAKFEASLQEHARLRQGLADGGLRYVLMSFTKN